MPYKKQKTASSYKKYINRPNDRFGIIIVRQSLRLQSKGNWRMFNCEILLKHFKCTRQDL